jgi:serine/threonine protein phosphatase PrpC
VFNISQKGWSKSFDSAKNCQDASDSYSEGPLSIIAVADGHGGEAHYLSEFGARFACDAAIKQMKSANMKTLRALLENGGEGAVEENLIQLEKSVINSWNELVKNDGRDETRAYGTTLLAVGADFDAGAWIGIQIGDGRLITSHKGAFYAPIPEDDRCVFNFTTSLCADDAILSFRHYAGAHLPDAVFLVTDGVVNSFNNDDALYSLLQRFLASKDVKELEEFLPVLSKKGSGDDVSAAGIIF